MANTYLPAQTYINLVLAELYQQTNLAGLITPYNGDNNFVGTLNDTLIYRTRGVTIARDYEFRVRTKPIIFDEVYRNQLPIKIDQHMTVGNRWTDEERTFDAPRIRSEIAAPMAEAMVTKFDAKIQAALLNANWAVTNLDVAAPSAANEQDNSALKAALGIQAKLNAAGTPKRGRVLVLGANAFQYFAASKSLKVYDPAQANTVFRQGVAGQIAGMEIFDGTAIVDDNDIIAVHPSWGVLANVAPANSESLAFCVRASAGGYAARLASEYDLSYASDRLLLNSFWGISEIRDQYARHTQATATAANDGSSKGDIIIEDGRTKFTGLNARGGRGVFSQL